jgi:hypothetical protein
MVYAAEKPEAFDQKFLQSYLHLYPGESSMGIAELRCVQLEHTEFALPSASQQIVRLPPLGGEVN